MDYEEDPATYGALGNGIHDDYGAICDAITAAGLSNRRVRLGRGTFYISQTLVLDAYVVIEGAGGGDPHASTWILSDRGVTPIRINSGAVASKIRELGITTKMISPWTVGFGGFALNTHCRSTVRTGRGAGHYPHSLPFLFKRIVAGLTGATEPLWHEAYLAGTLAVGDHFSDGDGIWECVQMFGIEMYTHAVLSDVIVTGISGTGISIYASTSDIPPTNANAWSLRHVHSGECDGAGVHVRGIDTNGGCATELHLYNNGESAFVDESELGNTWIAPVMEGNDGPVFKITSAVTSTTVINPYVEADQLPAWGAGGTVVVGGLLQRSRGGPGFDAAHRGMEYGSFTSPIAVLNQDGRHGIVSNLGQPGTGLIAQMIVGLTPWQSSETALLVRSLTTGGLDLVIGGDVIYRLPMLDAHQTVSLIAPSGVTIGSALHTTIASQFYNGRREVGDKLWYSDFANPTYSVPAIGDAAWIAGGRPEGLVCTVAGDAQGAGAIGAVTWAPLTAFAIGAKIVPTAGGSFVYRVCGVTSGATSPFLSGATEPVWPTSAFGAQVDDGGLVMQLFNWSTAQAVFKPFGLIGA